MEVFFFFNVVSTDEFRLNTIWPNAWANKEKLLNMLSWAKQWIWPAWLHTGRNVWHEQTWGVVQFNPMTIH